MVFHVANDCLNRHVRTGKRLGCIDVNSLIWKAQIKQLQERQSLTVFCYKQFLSSEYSTRFHSWCSIYFAPNPEALYNDLDIDWENNNQQKHEKKLHYHLKATTFKVKDAMQSSTQRSLIFKQIGKNSTTILRPLPIKLKKQSKVVNTKICDI